MYNHQHAALKGLEGYNRTIDLDHSLLSFHPWVHGVHTMSHEIDTIETSLTGCRLRPGVVFDQQASKWNKYNNIDKNLLLYCVKISFHFSPAFIAIGLISAIITLAGQRRHPVKDYTWSKTTPGQRHFNYIDLMRHSHMSSVNLFIIIYNMYNIHYML